MPPGRFRDRVPWPCLLWAKVRYGWRFSPKPSARVQWLRINMHQASKSPPPTRRGEHILVVEAIDPPSALVIIAYGNGIERAGTAHALQVPSNWLRLRGQFIEGTLQV